MNEKISIAATVDRDAMADEVLIFNQALTANLAKALEITGTGTPTKHAQYVWVQLNVEGLYETFTGAVDERTADEYNCSCCRSFTRRFLNVGILDTATGEIIHTLFPTADQVPGRFAAGVIAANAALRKANVIGVFPTTDLRHGHRLLGTKQAGGFNHFHFAVDNDLAKQLIAVNALESEIRLTQREELRDMLVRSLTAHDSQLVKAAVIRLQNAIGGYEADKFINNLSDFLEVQEKFNKTTSTNRARLLNNYAMRGNQAVIRMDTGGAILGTLLDKLKDAGEDARKIDAALNWLAYNSNGIRYRRQIAAPADATIERASKIFAERGLAPAMERRAISLDEVVDVVWQRSEAEAPAAEGGFFDKHKANKPVIRALPARKRTVRKSTLGEVLQQYSKLYLPVLYTYDLRVQLIGFTTAVHADAPPIYKWDKEENRFPFSAYIIHERQRIEAHGEALRDECRATNRVEIALVSNMADRFNGPTSLLAFLANGRQITDSGSAIFPENLRADLREVEKVIDLHSKQDRLANVENSCVAAWLKSEVIGVLPDGSEEHLTIVDAE